MLSMFPNIRGNLEGLGKIHSQKKIFPIPLSMPQAPLDVHTSVFTLFIYITLKDPSMGMKWGLAVMHGAPRAQGRVSILGGVVVYAHSTCPHVLERGQED